MSEQSMNELARAMHVILLTPVIRQHLKKNDPMAFRQAEDALIAEGPEIRTAYLAAVERISERKAIFRVRGVAASEFPGVSRSRLAEFDGQTARIIADPTEGFHDIEFENGRQLKAISAYHLLPV